MTIKYVAGIAGAMLLAAAAPATATTFTFTSGTNTATHGTAGNNVTLPSVDGITVTATGWSTDTLSSSPEAAYVGRYQMGLGVTNTNEANGDTFNAHVVDNVGSYDFIRLDFSKAVKLTGITLNAFTVNGGFSTDSDAWVSYGSGSLATNWSSYLANGVSVASGTAFSSTVASTTWLIGAARVSTDRDDGFKIGAVTAVAAVPEPATWAMMILGFGLVGGALRRRQPVLAAA